MKQHDKNRLTFQTQMLLVGWLKRHAEQGEFDGLMDKTIAARATEFLSAEGYEDPTVTISNIRYLAREGNVSWAKSRVVRSADHSDENSAAQIRSLDRRVKALERNYQSLLELLLDLAKEKDCEAESKLTNLEVMLSNLNNNK